MKNKKTYNTMQTSNDACLRKMFQIRGKTRRKRRLKLYKGKVQQPMLKEKMKREDDLRLIWELAKKYENDTEEIISTVTKEKPEVPMDYRSQKCST